MADMSALAHVGPRRARGQAVAEARYARRLHEAGDDPGAQFMAHVDRIRALKSALLTLTAADLLAGLIDRYQGDARQASAGVASVALSLSPGDTTAQKMPLNSGFPARHDNPTARQRDREATTTRTTT